jgi:hypothetical protein
MSNTYGFPTSDDRYGEAWKWLICHFFGLLRLEPVTSDFSWASSTLYKGIGLSFQVFYDQANN